MYFLTNLKFPIQKPNQGFSASPNIPPHTPALEDLKGYGQCSELLSDHWVSVWMDERSKHRLGLPGKAPVENICADSFCVYLATPWCPAV